MWWSGNKNQDPGEFPLQCQKEVMGVSKRVHEGRARYVRPEIRSFLDQINNSDDGW